jgi:phosphopentomutase
MTTPTVSFAEAVKGQQQKHSQQIQTLTATVGSADNAEQQGTDKEREQPAQTIRTPANSNTSSLDNMFKIATTVQQIMSGLNEAARKKRK